MSKTAKKLKSVIYSVNVEFLSKKSLSESGRLRLMGIITELVEKNKDLFGEDLRVWGYGVDNGQAATGAWEQMDRNRAKNEALKAEMEYSDLINKYGMEKAKFTSHDGKIIEDTVEGLIHTLPEILQIDEETTIEFLDLEDVERAIEVAERRGGLFCGIGWIKW